MTRTVKLLAGLTALTLLSACTATPAVVDLPNCYATSISGEPTKGVTAAIIKQGDAFPAGAIPTTYTLDQLKDYQFGFLAGAITENLYITEELCNNDTGKQLRKPQLEKTDAQLFKPAAQGSSGSYINFIYKVSGADKNFITAPGKYTVYAIGSTADGDWRQIAKFEFTVSDQGSASPVPSTTDSGTPTVSVTASVTPSPSK